MEREDRIERMRSLTGGAVAELSETVDEVSGRVERNPYGAVAAALGVGYVLGGGLRSPLTTRLLGLGLRVGLRLALVPIIQDQLVSLVQGAAGDSSGAASATRKKTIAHHNGDAHGKTRRKS